MERGKDQTTKDANSLRVAFADLNGQPRGKRLPADFADKVTSGIVRAPLSACNLDIWGSDIEGSPLVFESGDADGILRVTNRGAVALPWMDHPTLMFPTSVYADDGSPFAGDARHALVACLERYATLGWRVSAATEVEFYLLDPTTLTPALGSQIKGTEGAENVLSLATLDAFEAFFDDLYAGAGAMDIPAQAAISESGSGQFEINLNHQDALRAADDCWLFKQLIRGVAEKHGMLASFAAKPFDDLAGSGLHVHFSVTDTSGQNIFDDGTEEGSRVLHHAIAGCLDAMAASTLIFAPHGPSYDRLIPNAHAPTGVAWGYENRTTALRVPGGAFAARRVEHRVAGVDANPYLLLTAILGAAWIGIEDKMTPPPPVIGNAYDRDLRQIPDSWAKAIDLFATQPLNKRIFPPMLIENLVRTKRQELSKAETIDPSHLRATYLSLL